MLPADIAELGGADEAPRLDPAANLTGSGLTPEDYFVLSRVDGRTTVRQIVQLAGGMMAETKVVDILKKLKSTGAIALGPLAAGTPPASAAAAATPPVRKPEPTPPAAIRARPPTPLATPKAERAPSPTPPTLIQTSGLPPPVIDERLLLEAADLDVDQKRRVLEVHALLQVASHFELLGISTDADKNDIKRSYFKLSKEFHPDRFYKKKLGSYEERLSDIFKRINHAYEVLSDDGKRAAYALTLKARGRTRPP